MNLDEIAEKARVSRATVSRVINNHPRVSEQTRARVLAVIERAGFTPDPFARGMVTRRTHVIAVVIPTSFATAFKDSIYYPTLLEGISKAINSADYGMMLWIGQPGEDEKLFQNRVLKNRLMDGLIVASATTTNQRSFIENLLRLQIPFVMVERPIHHADQVNYVTIDNVQASQNLVLHLIKLGYSRIGKITGSMNNVDSQDRLTGYRQALELGGISYDDALVVEGNFTREVAYQAMQVLLDRGVDAVFVGNDFTAHGAAQAITDTGRRIPDDIALVGFDDLPYASQYQPPLTTARQPIQEKGARATKLLLDVIEGKVHTAQHQILSAELVIRESCGINKYRGGEA